MADDKAAVEEKQADIEGEATEVDEQGDEAQEVEVEVHGSEDPAESVKKALARTPGGTGQMIKPLDADQVVEGMKQYQELLPQLLEDSDYQAAGGSKRFVKKSGWRKIAKAFGLSVEIVSTSVERDDEGDPVRSTVIARAIHPPSGQFSDGDGHCSVTEERFSGPRGNKSKLENDLRATATTRAKNRAISDLVGMGEVSAEEVGDNRGPTYGPAADKNLAPRISNALIYLFGDDAEKVWNEIADECGGYMPEKVGKGALICAKWIKDKREAEAAADPSESDEGDDEKEESADEG